MTVHIECNAKFVKLLVKNYFFGNVIITRTLIPYIKCTSMKH